MRKGISPIVAVVLLIAIAVIAAVGLYFWVGGLATKQPTPNTPITMSAQRVSCTPGTNTTNVTIMVQNLAASGTITSTDVKIVDNNGWSVGADTASNIAAGNQVAFTWVFTGAADATNLTLSTGSKYVVLGGTNVGQAQFVC